MSKLYVFVASVSACLLAQLLKPIGYFVLHNKWDFKLIGASGGMPSSHTALVTALSISVGLTDGFTSNTFYIALCFACIISFDAANVRYYAGQNISLTHKLINDLKELNSMKIRFDDPIYQKKMKEVLGHTYFEVLGGIILGIAVSYLCYIIFGGTF
ncbi:MAG: divergent PAP2 family protein [Erysipelotrichia bacterium]|nr:divergent PAP2 family protein [Erysipelotrichia bacterium]